MWCEKQRFVVRFVSVWLAVSLCFACASCSFASSQKEYVSKTYLMMDTVIEVKLRCDATTAQPILTRCGEIMTQVENVLSRTVSESTVAVFNETGQATLDADTAAVLARALEVAARTNGTFDPTVDGLVSLWSTCGEENRLPTDAELAERLSHVGTDKLMLTDGVLTRTDAETTLDLGAIGKGYAIDRLLEYLKTTSVPGGVLSFGGNVAVFGTKGGGEPYRIGVRDPQNTSSVLGYLNMSSGVISVSGDYERYVTVDGVRYHHILNPETGYPVENGLHSVAVICEDGALADALSTALFVMGVDRAMDFYRSGGYEFEAIFTTNDEIVLTDGLAYAGYFELTAAGYAVRETAG